jgi:hypothetical protein
MTAKTQPSAIHAVDRVAASCRHAVNRLRIERQNLTVRSHRTCEGFIGFETQLNEPSLDGTAEATSRSLPNCRTAPVFDHNPRVAKFHFIFQAGGL